MSCDSFGSRIKPLTHPLFCLRNRRGDSTSNGIFYGVLDAARPFRRPGLNGEDTTGRLRVDSRALGGAAMEVVPGDGIGVAGPLDFGARTYTVLPQEVFGLLGGRRTPLPLPAAVTGEFTIATLNLQRFFNSCSI